MTSKQKIIKMCLFTLCITLSVISFIMIWYKDTDLWETLCLCLSLIFLALSIVALKYPKINYKKIREMINVKIKENPISLERVNEIYRYYGLENKELNILKLYFNKDYTQRCIFYQNSNGVRVKFEYIEYFSDESKFYGLRFADWFCDYKNDAVGFYADCEIAYRESKASLKNFHEDDMNFKLKHQISVRIIWNDWKVDSKELPFGERIILDMKYKNNEYVNIEIDLCDWISDFYCKADIFIDADYEFNKNNKCKFNLYKNGKKVGVAFYDK